jgi:molybdopterin-guanine dinucleotide biosynthesis protein A
MVGESGNLGMGARTEISGFVLAGGRSSRLGRDKALLPWPPNAAAEGNGQTLLAHAMARLQRVCDTVSICANRDDLPTTEIVIPDARPGSGPLGGIVAALEHSTTDWNLLLAVDLPFLPVAVLQSLAARASAPAETMVASGVASLPSLLCVLPSVDGLPQPLCGLYHRALASGLRRALEAGKFKVMAALYKAADASGLGSHLQPEISSAAIELWDAATFAGCLQLATNPAEWFMNINTPEDWERAQQLCSE